MLHNLAFLGLSGVPEIIAAILIVAILVFEIAMLVSAIGNKHIDGSTKTLWIVGMFLIHPFVAIAYYFTDYNKTR
jgi:hypothetical protein